MRVGRDLIVGWSIQLAATHSQWPIAVIELVDEFRMGVGNTNGTDNFVALHNDATRSISLAS